MNKVLRVTAMSILFVLSASGCGKALDAGREPARGIRAREMRVAVQPIPHSAPLFVAKRKGWLDEELGRVGVAVKWSYFFSEPPMNESLAAGEQDIGLMGDAQAILGRASGQDTRIVGVASAEPTAPAVAAERSTTAAPADLKRKKVDVMVATNAFASRNPELVSIFLKVYQRGKDFIKENPLEAARLVSIEVKLPSRELVQVLARFDFDPHLHDDDIAELKKTEGFMRRTGLIKGPVDIASFIGAGRLRVEGIR
ncbi:MAG: ABC transporter substrate-binding protein [Deltaproteobacteria bacterium]|nr:ABC transporter substrate-binding protein [Deltaproteobacteria bacterium]